MTNEKTRTGAYYSGSTLAEAVNRASTDWPETSPYEGAKR